MPKKKPPKLTVVFTDDPAVIADMQRPQEWGKVVEGFTDSKGRSWVIPKTLAAFKRKQEREEEERRNRG